VEEARQEYMDSVVEKFERGCGSTSHVWPVDDDGKVHPGTPCHCNTLMWTKEDSGFTA